MECQNFGILWELKSIRSFIWTVLIFWLEFPFKNISYFIHVYHLLVLYFVFKFNCIYSVCLFLLISCFRVIVIIVILKIIFWVFYFYSRYKRKEIQRMLTQSSGRVGFWWDYILMFCLVLFCFLKYSTSTVHVYLNIVYCLYAYRLSSPHLSSARLSSTTSAWQAFFKSLPTNFRAAYTACFLVARIQAMYPTYKSKSDIS